MPTLHLEQLGPRVGKGDLLELLDKTGGLPGTRVGRIELAGGRATIEVPSGWEQRLARALDGAMLAGRKLRAWAGEALTAGTPGSEDHFQRLVRLLELERAAEAQRALERGRRLSRAAAERSGETLVDLVIVDEEAGLGWPLPAHAWSNATALPSPGHGWASAAPWCCRPTTDARNLSVRGVVYDRREDIDLGRRGRDCPTSWRTLSAGGSICRATKSPASANGLACERAIRRAAIDWQQLRDVLLGEREPEFDELRGRVDRSTPGLNATQLEPWRFALCGSRRGADPRSAGHRQDDDARGS